MLLPVRDGAPTLRSRADAAEAERRGAAISHPLVQAALDAFPGATVEAVHGDAPAAGEEDGAATGDETTNGDDPA